MSYVILAAGWVIYFAIHSILAATQVKEWARVKLGGAFKFYRVVYSIISIGGLVGLMLANGRLSGSYFFEDYGILRFVSLVLTVTGVICLQLAFRQYKLSSFLGFRPETSELRRTGILKKIRHPIYLGLILLTLGFFLFIPNLASLISSLCILVYLPIGTYLEEKKMIRHYGEAYLTYKKEVPSILPKF